MGRGDCPPWCAQHVTGLGGEEHRAVVGDVRLTLSGDSGARRAIYAVRRRAARTPAEMAQLAEDLTAAGLLLRRAAARELLSWDDRSSSVVPAQLAAV